MNSILGKNSSLTARLVQVAVAQANDQSQYMKEKYESALKASGKLEEDMAALREKVSSLTSEVYAKGEQERILTERVEVRSSSRFVCVDSSAGHSKW